MSTGEAANLVGVSRRTILRWVKQGRLRAYEMPSGHNHVLAEDVKKILAQQAPKPVSEVAA